MNNDRYKWWSDSDRRASLAARQQVADDAQARLGIMGTAFEAASSGEFAGLSADEITRMNVNDYAIRSGRPTPGQAALANLYDDEADFVPPGTPRAIPAPQPSTSGPQGIDFASMSIEQYAQLRGQLGIGVSRKEGRGVFDSVDSQSPEFQAAARAQSLRTGWNNSNVTEPPRISMAERFERQDDRDTRSAADRFSNAATFWQR